MSIVGSRQFGGVRHSGAGFLSQRKEPYGMRAKVSKSALQTPELNCGQRTLKIVKSTKNSKFKIIIVDM
jgi:hypothetical protein